MYINVHNSNLFNELILESIKNYLEYHMYVYVSMYLCARALIKETWAYPVL